MNDPTIIALISASSAITGASVTQAVSFLISHVDKKHQRKILLRQKYEEMSNHFVQSLDWLGEVGSSKTLSTLQSKFHPSSARYALSLCSIYFPEMKNEFKLYLDNCSAFYQSLVSHFNESEMKNYHGTDSIVAMAFAKRDDKNYENIMENLKNSIETVDGSITRNACKYTKA